jgi:gliding motility-associated lipoprotein GldH
MRFLVVLVCLISLVTACDSRRIYEDTRDFNDRSWRMTDTARFEFFILDPGKKYNLYYNIRNSLDYPYARLFVNYSLQDSTGAELQKKLISEYLFDQKTGQPQGSSGLGDLYDHRFPLLNEYKFRHSGKYKLELEQFMRMDTLPGVLSVGLRVETAPPAK